MEVKRIIDSNFLIGAGVGFVVSCVGFCVMRYLTPPKVVFFSKSSGSSSEEESGSGSGEESSDETESGSEFDEDCKMLLAVNTSIKEMKPGKAMAQCGHATLGAYREAKKSAKKELRTWRGGEAKIAVKIDAKEMYKKIKEPILTSK